MLRSEHAIVRMNYSRGEVHPDRLNRRTHAHYLQAARQCLHSYANGIGEDRESLHRHIETVLRPLGDCPPRRIASFCKLLDDAGSFDTAAGRSVRLRQRVFEIAADLHPIVSQKDGLFDHDVDASRQRVAAELGMSWRDIEDAFFADVLELQRLKAFDASLTPERLLARYNVAQTQATLYRATRVELSARSDLKRVVRGIKLSGLMHRIEQVHADPPAYRIRLDGPAAVLRGSTRYGVRFAKLLAFLLSCRDWQMRASIRTNDGRPMRMVISDRDGLTGEHEQPDEMDSQWEAEFAKCWVKDPVDGWELRRESQLLSIGQHVFTPDFVLRRRQDGQTIQVELVGFWTPEYLKEKAATLTKFSASASHWLIVVPKSPSSEQQQAMGRLGLSLIAFDKRRRPQQWIETALATNDSEGG
ncbi:MAG: DUF790 family protein [Planctomycetota bacterium]